MSNITITFPSPNGIGIKNHIIKAMPNTTLIDIINQTCEKYQLGQSGGFALRYNKKILDSSLSFRFANIRSGAKLELVKVNLKNNVENGKVEIALQIEGERMIESIPIRYSLLQILDYYDKKYNSIENSLLLKTTDQGNWLSPTCQIMNKEIFGLKDLTDTSLLSLGLKQGKVLIRVNFRTTEDSLGQVKEALNQIQLNTQVNNNVTPIKTVEKQTRLKDTSNTRDKENNVNNSEQSNVEQINEEMPDNEQLIEKYEIHVYLAPKENHKYANQVELDDSFFELNSTELKLLASQQQAETKRIIEGEPLMTSAMRQQKINEKIAKYPTTTIRIKFPDNNMIQMKFDTKDKFSKVLQVLNFCLINHDYYLFRSPPVEKFIDVENHTLFKLNLFPASLIYFKPLNNSNGPFIKPNFMERATYLPNMVEIEPIQNKVDSNTINNNNNNSSKENNRPSNNDQITSASKDPTKNKLSKWLRLSKK